MKPTYLYYILFFVSYSCYAQKIEIEKDVFPEEIKELPAFIYIEDIDFKEDLRGKEIIINEKSQYQFKDSILADGNYFIKLHYKFSSDVGPIPYGFLEGKIINGIKEGTWTKQIYCKDTTVVVKIMNYTNGLLDGKYMVFSLEGDTLFYSKPHPLFPDSKNYEIFEEGTGYYFDYYYDIGILKEKGLLRKGKKDGHWIIYDRQGNEIKRDIYHNGVLVSD